MDLLDRLHREQGVTFVLVTHDPTVAGHASRTIAMKDGRIVPQPQSEA
jgi:putative ABC transport system ATP-binding protein